MVKEIIKKWLQNNDKEHLEEEQVIEELVNQITEHLENKLCDYCVYDVQADTLLNHQ